MIRHNQPDIHGANHNFTVIFAVIATEDEALHIQQALLFSEERAWAYRIDQHSVRLRRVYPVGQAAGSQPVWKIPYLALFLKKVSFGKRSGKFLMQQSWNFRK